MWHRVKDLWQHNRPALLAFLTALCLLGFFGVSTVSQMIYWADPRHQDQALAGWMTPRYVARSHKIPPEVVQEAFFLEKDRPPVRISIDAIASDNDMTITDLQNRLDAIVANWRATNPRGNP